ncbi:MAG: small nuclear ribonucleoprotein [Candidatus Diapherotrites archaeon]|nr:small nuclear ribonucleoprotein [Candidatus Diapherotrites archaeon]
MTGERPFDLLTSSVGKSVLVELKGGVQFRGVMKAYDIHMNIVIDDAEELEEGEVKKKLGTLLLRGDNVLFISP